MSAVQKMQAKLNELLVEWDNASADEKYWIGLEIEDLEKKIEAANR